MNKARLLLGLLGLASLGAIETHAVERALDFDAVVHGADVIFVGRVSEIRSWELPGKAMIFTDVRFDTDEVVFVGQRATIDPARSITLTFPGGVVGERGISVGDQPRFAIDERYVIFALADGTRYTTPLVGGTQGLFKIVGDVATSSEYPVTATGAAIRGVNEGKLELTAIATTIENGMAQPVPPTRVTLVAPRAASPEDLAVSRPAPEPEQAQTVEAFLEATRAVLELPPPEVPASTGGEPIPFKLPERARTDFESQPIFDAGEISRAPLCFQGRVTPNLTIEQMPSNTWPYPENNDAMWQWNQFMDLYRFTAADGTFGVNGMFEFGSFPTSTELFNIYGIAWGPTTLGLTWMTWSANLEITEADVFFTPSTSWFTNLSDTLNVPGRTLYRTVVMHELGHTWGSQAIGCTEDYAYTELTVMHAIYNNIVEDGWGIHAWDALAYRTNYATVLPGIPRKDVGVESYFADGSGTLVNSSTDWSNYYLGGSFTIKNVTVENMSNQDVAAVRLRAYLSADNVISPSDYLLGSHFEFGTLIPYSRWTGDLTTTIPTQVTPGTYFIGLIVTTDGDVWSEDDLSFNNRTYLAKTITVLPQNDECSGAPQVGLGSTPFSTIGATVGSPFLATGCTLDDQIHHDVWYTFFPSCDGNLTATTCGELGGQADYDSVIAIFDCSCAFLSEPLGCNDDDPFHVCGQSPVYASSVTVPVTAGTCYAIRVGGAHAAAQGTGVLNLTLGGTVPNETCGTAFPIGEGLNPIDSRCASTTPLVGTCGAMSSDVWFDYSAACSGIATIGTCEQTGGFADFDTVVEIYDGGGSCPPTNLEQLTCNDDAALACGGFPNRQSLAQLPVQQGAAYRVRVGGYSGASGTGGLNVACHEMFDPNGEVWDTSPTFTTANGWFPDPGYPHVFAADVSGDGREDLVGLANNGDAWVQLSTGTGFAPVESWRIDTGFSIANGWFNLAWHDRIWIVDVTGDGAADILGIADNGDLWVAESTGASFAPSHLAASSIFTAPTYLSLAFQRLVWVVDVTGDGSADVVGISPTGVVSVSVATGSGSSASFAPSATWLVTYSAGTGNIFIPQLNWFGTDSRARVWPADVTGDGLTDLVGIDYVGDVWVSESLGTGFASSHVAMANGIMRTSGVNPDSQWFSTSSQTRVWPADVTGDGRIDIVGVAPTGDGDGDVWAAIATGSATDASFTERVLLRDSVFRTSVGFFSSAYRPRVMVGDVTGDGAADLLGVDDTGVVWLARAAHQSASATAPSPGDATRWYLEPSLATGPSRFQLAAGYFTGTRDRVWLIDVTGDGVRDLVGVSPGIAQPDGQKVWRAVAPTTPLSVTPLDRAAIESGTPQQITVEFSRTIDPASVTAATLEVEQAGLPLAPTDVTVFGRFASWTVSFAPTGGGETDVRLRLPHASALDQWGAVVDMDGDWTVAGDLARHYRWDDTMVAGTARFDLSEFPSGFAGLPFPGGLSYCALGVPSTVGANPPQGRVLAIYGDGTCATGADCGTGQTCSDFECLDALGQPTNDPLILVSVHQTAIDASRVHSAISARTGIPGERVIVAASGGSAVPRSVHPFISPYHDDRETPLRYEAYSTWIENEIVAGVERALDNLEPVTIATGSIKLPALPQNRRDFTNVDQVSTDQDEHVIKFRRVSDGALVATILHVAVQPRILTGLGFAVIDADFPGYMTSELEAPCAASDCVAVFLNGAAGDVQTLTGAGGDDELIAQGYGLMLADGANQIANAPLATTGMQILSERQITTFSQGVSSCANCITAPPRSHLRPTPWEVASTTVAVGVPGEAPALALSTVPGEAFVRLGLRLKAESPLQDTLLVGYANGYLGTFPDAAALTDGLDPAGVQTCNGASFFDPSDPPGEALVTAAVATLTDRLRDCSVGKDSLRLVRDSVAGTVSLSWDGALGPWDVAQGDLEALRAGDVFTSAVCLADDTVSAIFEDTGVSTALAWYLTRCDDRSWGAGTAGAARGVDLGVCP